MLVSKKSLYAIRALLELTADFEQKPVNSATIAKRQGVSSRFIEIILNELKHAGIVESRRGSSGGYLLGKHPRDISVLDVISCIDGPISIVSQTKDEKKVDYFGNNTLNGLWTKIQSEIKSDLEARTLKDLFEEEKAFRNKNICNYSI